MSIDLNLIKTIVASISVIIALIAGFIELRLNPDSWLNRWFALFFYLGSDGILYLYDLSFSTHYW